MVIRPLKYQRKIMTISSQFMKIPHLNIKIRKRYLPKWDPKFRAFEAFDASKDLCPNTSCVRVPSSKFIFFRTVRFLFVDTNKGVRRGLVLLCRTRRFLETASDWSTQKRGNSASDESAVASFGCSMKRKLQIVPVSSRQEGSEKFQVMKKQYDYAEVS